MLTDNTSFSGLTPIKTPGQHGSDEAIHAIGDLLGQASAVVFKHPAEKTLYLAGDTVCNQYVESCL
ncbi:MULTISPECIES: hypothetical protein [Burkholderia]|uniref:hypothetical protein n=1 Tax=Burkholderia TaxID=32008 RepID=UPI00158FB795|nr:MULTISPECIES: hypothetical protein [Burkholderia]